MTPFPGNEQNIVLKCVRTGHENTEHEINSLKKMKTESQFKFLTGF